MNINELNRHIIEQCGSLGVSYECGSSGAVGSNIAFVAEAPGEREVHMKIPLCGGSGQLLWDELRTQGMNRQQAYVTNVYKRQLTTSASTARDVRPPTKRETELYEQILTNELEQLPNLRVIVLLGSMALTALTGRTGIESWRGSVIQNEALKLRPDGARYTFLVCNNPALVLREPREGVIFRFHINKLRRILAGNVHPYEIDALIDPSFDDALSFIEDIHAAAVNHDVPIAFDIETPNNQLGCIGFANESHRGMCINLRTLDDNSFTVEQEIQLYQRFQKLFIDERVRFIAQNGLFDTQFMWFWNRIETHGIWMDTMLAHHTLYPQLPHDLGFLTAQYTDHPFYKDEKNNWKEKHDIGAFWRYNVKDCCLTFDIHTHLVRELDNQGMRSFFFDHVMHANKHLIRLNVGGVRCDRETKDEFTATLREEVSNQLHLFHELAQRETGNADYMPNPNSPVQMRDLLFTRLRLVGRGMSTDYDNRRLILKHSRTSPGCKELILALDRYLKEHKFLTTYAEMEVDEDDRFRCTYKQHGVSNAPGRLSSSGTGWGTGGNLQNIPSRAYSMFIADPGYCFIYFDLSQAEARVVGWKARIQHWIDDFEKARQGGDFDCHRALAAQMFDVPYDQVPTKDEDSNGNKTIRFYAKRSRHGFNYRLGPDTFSIKNDLPIAKSTELHALYLRSNPELRKWWESVDKAVRTKHALFNAFGRRLLYLSRISDDDIQTAIAFYPQSTVGDKVTRVIYQAHEDKDWPTDARICMNIHDALIGLAPFAKAKTCLSIMTKYAEEPIDIDGMPLIIPAECKMSVPDDKGLHRWSNLKKVEL